MNHRRSNKRYTTTDTDGTRSTRHDSKEYPRWKHNAWFRTRAMIGVAICLVVVFLSRRQYWHGPMDTTRITKPTTTTTSKNHHLDLQSKNVVLIHIGKTGGSALRRLIDRAVLYCTKSPPHGETHNATPLQLLHHMCALANITHSRTTNDETGLVHLDRNLHKTLTGGHFLVTIRNPIDRLRSWYSYELYFHSVKKTRYSFRLENLATRCGFRTFGQLVTAKNHNHSNNSTSNCFRLAKDCLDGSLPCYSHNFFNYEYYLEDVLVRVLQAKAAAAGANRTTNNSTSHFVPRIDVVRAEDSLNDLHRALVEWTGIPTTPDDMANYYTIRKPFNVENHYNNNNNNTTEDFSGETSRRLCTVLCRELVVYTKIVRYASNLSPLDKHEALRQLETTCNGNNNDNDNSTTNVFSVRGVCGHTFRYRRIRDTKRSQLCEPRSKHNNNQKRSPNTENEESSSSSLAAAAAAADTTNNRRRLSYLQSEKEYPSC